MSTDIKINPNGFREYDARWLYPNDIDLEGIEELGKGLGTQVIKKTKKPLFSFGPQSEIFLGPKPSKLAKLFRFDPL